MIPRYGKLNKIYTGIMSGDSFSFEKQQFISDFYREYGDTQPFETALISLMLEMDAAHFSILLNSLNVRLKATSRLTTPARSFSTVSIPDMSADSMKAVLTGVLTDR